MDVVNIFYCEGVWEWVHRGINLRWVLRLEELFMLKLGKRGIPLLCPPGPRPVRGFFPAVRPSYALSLSLGLC